MKILLYNWAGIEGNDGGGVNVYVKNLIKGLLKKDYDVAFLNSGVKYTRDGKLRIEKLSDAFGGCHRYEIINSPVLAPAHAMFDNLESVVENKKLKNIVYQFLKDKKFDLVHFHNIEGLSLDILDIRKEIEIKFIYSFHNYHTVCPQVNLWKDESENCIDNSNFKDCVNCVFTNNINKEVDRRICRFQHIIIRGLRSFYRHRVKNAMRKIFKKNNEATTVDKYEKFSLIPTIYKRYVEKSIESINKNIDILISVSKRTHDVVCKKGIRTDNHKVMYIGTSFAKKSNVTEREYLQDDILSLAYLGYMRHDKGYFYLLWLLENMSDYLARHINLTVAARCFNSNELERLKKIEKRLYSLNYYNGYTHKNLDKILSGIDLGVVPVLWEDCLPQVAIEFVCHGIPILTSDLGGARELGKNDNFVYSAKSKSDFEDKVASFVYNKSRLNGFWENCLQQKTVAEHVDEIDALYQGLKNGDV